jgi:hypothetical protein
MANTRESALVYAFAIGIPLLLSEHVFSANLSSPWTTGKLAQTQEDQSAFWKLFAEASLASLAFAVIIGWTLYKGLGNGAGPLVISIGMTMLVIGWMAWDYMRALDGSLYT